MWIFWVNVSSVSELIIFDKSLYCFDHIFSLTVEGHEPQVPEVVKEIDGAMVDIGAAACSLIFGSSTATGCSQF